MARIVVADDDDDIRELVEFKLASLGHEIVACADAVTALAACRAQQPDLVILDVMMPGMTGLEVLAELRSEARFAETPVVMLTARALGDDIAGGIASGASEYITKPFSPRELAARVTSMLG
jgi:two-component system response regulator MtrA